MKHKLVGAVGLAALSLGVGLGAPPAVAASSQPPAAPGWDPGSKTLTITSLYPESGPVAGGALFLVGLQAWFHRATQPGGEFSGYTIKMNAPDTQYQDNLTIQFYQQYKNQSALIETLATPSLLPLKQDNILAIGSGLDSSFVHDPNWIGVGPTTQTIVADMIAYAAQVEGKKSSNYCVLQQNGVTGQPYVAATRYATKKLGLKYGTTVPFTYPLSDATPVIVRLRAAKCQEVVVGGVTPTMVDLAARGAQLNYAPQWLVDGSGVSPHIATGPDGAYVRKNVKMVYFGGDWGSTHPIGEKRLAADVKAVDAKAVPDAVSYETGYCQGMVTTAILKKALENGDLSRAGIIKASNEVGQVNFEGLCGGGYNYGHSPATRIPPHTVTVFKFVTSTVTGLKSIKLNYDPRIGNTVPGNR